MWWLLLVAVAVVVGVDWYRGFPWWTAFKGMFSDS